MKGLQCEDGKLRVIYAFGEFELDTASGVLRRGEQTARLRPTPLRVLVQLLRHRDRVVTREELADRVWGGNLVSDAAVATAIKEIRHALGDHDASQGMLRTLRRRGYRFVAPVVEQPARSTGAPADAVEKPCTGTPLVGRAAIVSRLEDALDRLEHGRGGMLLLSGEPGIGKTRIVEELSVRARARGVRAELAWCWQGEGAPPYWLWTQVLRHLLGRREPAELRAALGPDAGILSSLLPGFAGWEGAAFPSAEGSPEPGGHGEADDPQQARFRLFDAYASLLVRRAAVRPLVLILEDLHWAGPASLQLLEFLGREARGVPLLLVGTCRPEAGAGAEGAGSVLARLATSPHCEVIAVEGLDDDGVRDFVRSIARIEPAGSLVGALRRHTGGNPFFLGELLRAHAAALREGRLEILETGDVPLAVRSAIAQRLAALPEGCREIAALAAVAHRPPDVELLLRAADCDADTAARAIDRLRRDRLLEAGSEGGGLRFVHELARDAVYAELDPGERRSLHGRVAAALEELYAADRTPVLDALAEHFEQAAQPAEAGRYARLAGDAARRSLAFERAVGSYERGLRCLVGMDDAAELERGELLLRLGRSLEATGDVTGGAERMAEASELARRLSAGELLARCALSRARFSLQAGDRDAPMRELLQEALDALGDSSDAGLRLRVESRLGQELRYVEPSRARRLLDDAVVRARTLHDPVTIGRAILDRTLAIDGPGMSEELLASDRECLRLAREAGDVALELLARRDAVSRLLELGDRVSLDAETASIRRRVQQVDDPVLRAWLEPVRAMEALLDGCFADAETLIRDALEGALRHGDRGRSMECGAQLAFLFFHTGRWADLRSIADTLVARNPKMAAATLAVANADCELGDAPRARRTLESFARDGFEGVPWDDTWLLCLCLLTRLCERLEAPEHAAELERRMRPFSPWCVSSSGVCFHGSVCHHLGVATALQGRADDAIAHFEAALAVHRSMGALPWQVWTGCALGELLVARGGAAAERGLGLLAEAAKRAETLGMTDLAHRARAGAWPGEAVVPLDAGGRTTGR